MIRSQSSISGWFSATRAVLCGLLVVASAFAAKTDFSTDWRFHLGDAAGAEAKDFSDAGWERVTAPHTARIEALVTNKTDKQQWEGICWYRKTFTPPPAAKGQVVLLRFEGAMNVAQVFINGEKRTESIDGYTPFVVDVSKEAASGAPITVALRLDNRANEITGPKKLDILDFHLYHGLYRTVSMIVKPAVHITDEIFENKPASGGVFVTYPHVSDNAATVSTQVHVRNAGAQGTKFSVATILRTLAGQQVASAELKDLELAPGADNAFVTKIEVPQPKLWSPQAPNLYYLDVTLTEGGKVFDSERVRIGIRRAELGPRGITLNGRKLFLRGVNRHQEYPYVGNAVPGNAQYRDAWKIKQAGFDYIRLSHYPHSREFMDACDELGLVVMDAILGWQYNPGTPAFRTNRVAASRALVRRDRNYACALFWELALNETAMKPDFISELHAVGHEEYPGDQMFTAGWVKGYDIKISARQHNSTREFKNAAFPCIVSEYGDWEYYAQNAGLNQDAWQNLGKAERNSRQLRGDGEVRMLQQATNLQEAHNDNRSTNALADGYWVMFDYNRGYAEDIEASGIMDIFRLPKFSYAFFRSQRDADEKIAGVIGGPMVEIASYWTEQSPLSARVFSNCEEVELFLNGRSLGRQKPDANRLSDNLAHPPFTFALPKFEPGELKAVAYRGGVTAAQHIVETPGAVKRLELTVDESGRPLASAGDLVFVYASLMDAKRSVVPTAKTPVTFHVDEGDAQLIGTNPIAAEAGIATVLLKTGHRKGAIKLRATCEGLETRLTVRAR